MLRHPLFSFLLRLFRILFYVAGKYSTQGLRNVPSDMMGGQHGDINTQRDAHLWHTYWELLWNIAGYEVTCYIDDPDFASECLS